MRPEPLELTPLTTTHVPASVAGSTIVLIAEKLDVASINQVWLVKNGIVQEEELMPQSVFTPEVVIVPTNRFCLVVQPGRLQLTLAPQAFAGEDAGTMVNNIAGALIKALPNIVPQAIGLNFDLTFWPTPPNTFMPWCRDVFCAPGAKNLEETSSEDARFGCYFSFNDPMFRVRVNIRPSKFMPFGIVDTSQVHFVPITGALPDSVNPDQDVMNASINFHRDELDIEMILRGISRWQDSLHLVQKIVHSFFV